MTLWTVQPVEIYTMIQETGIYRCNPDLIDMPDYTKQYDWLVKQMKKRIGPPPDGVKYPVWAWYEWYGKQQKPDLRRMRWETGPSGDKLACIEVEIPEEKVLLSDEETWHLVLGDWYISDSEEECNQIEAYLASMPEEQRSAFKQKNWERVFNITTRENSWLGKADFIQATF